MPLPTSIDTVHRQLRDRRCRWCFFQIQTSVHCVDVQHLRHLSAISMHQARLSNGHGPCRELQSSLPAMAQLCSLLPCGGCDHCNRHCRGLFCLLSWNVSCLIVTGHRHRYFSQSSPTYPSGRRLCHFYRRRPHHSNLLPSFRVGAGYEIV